MPCTSLVQHQLPNALYPCASTADAQSPVCSHALASHQTHGPHVLQVGRLFETELPKDASATRVKNRCVLTGRPRAVHRFARVSRIMLRQLAHAGLLPGVSKASW